MSLFAGKLKTGLTKTRLGFIGKMANLFSGKEITESTIEEFEELLISADIGMMTTQQIIEALKEEIQNGKIRNYEHIRTFLKSELTDILGLPQPFSLYAERPFVVLCIGVNGVGKTTTIGKLANKAVLDGHITMLAACDTFRAAAIEQLEIWSRRAGSQFIKHQAGSDPAAVAFDAVEAAKARSIDLLIVDTAGRLHTKNHLMQELKKIKRVIGKSIPDAPHEVLLVLDATNGQNALNQAREFHQMIGVTGLALTKMDGSAKGGIVFAIKNELNIPVRLIGVGEGIEDFDDFIPQDFIEALFN
ncbi:MAG: signal recognition particle-docking protein FtsY [Nitrospirae bacterium]|nr:signal recognition particle-docking protein FtsY [Nitrospirota bacterium]MBF0540446.1 signal recognition particle-docking protein FtsY [Nitrospirota bacterium]